MSYIPAGQTIREYISRMQVAQIKPTITDAGITKTQIDPSIDTSCPEGRIFNVKSLTDPNQKRCIIYCPEGSYYDSANRICRPVRSGTPSCEPGEIFGPKGVCQPGPPAATQTCKLNEDPEPCASRLCKATVKDGLMPPELLKKCVPWMTNRLKRDAGVRVLNFLTHPTIKTEIDTWRTEMAAKLAEEEAGLAPPPPLAAGMPKWVLPVAIGGAALAVVLILKKRRG